MGIKKQKGTVSIEDFRNRIRLRWRFNGKRYSVSLGPYDKLNLKAAKKTVLQIELDMVNSQFDDTLVKYGAKVAVVPEAKLQPLTIVEHFERWVKEFKQLDSEKNSDYFHLRNTLRKWGEISPDEMLIRLNTEKYAPKTYNERLAILSGFSKWMVKRDYWKANPFDGVSKRRVKKVDKPDRQPFTEEEIRDILAAVRNNVFCPPSSRYRHSHYYPFLYFLFKTGVRNAEAVGLRVGSIDLKNKIILIKEAMARSVHGTHASARIRKGTKNGKVRMLQLTADLMDVLSPLLTGKSPDDLVFQSFSGLPIDDKMFQRRVFSIVLKGLNISHRVLYACRHTFGSRCIDAGITPVMTAFLMGNNPETALRNYTHQLKIPDQLPHI